MFAGRMFAATRVMQRVTDFGPGKLGFIAHGHDGTTQRERAGGRIVGGTDPTLDRAATGHIDRPTTGEITT